MYRMVKRVENGKQLVIKVPADLLDALTADADANGRTVTQSIRFLLAKSPTIAERLDAPEASPA